MGKIVPLLLFCKDSFGIKITQEGWNAIKQKNQKKKQTNKHISLYMG